MFLSSVFLFFFQYKSSFPTAKGDQLLKGPPLYILPITREQFSQRPFQDPLPSPKRMSCSITRRFNSDSRLQIYLFPHLAIRSRQIRYFSLVSSFPSPAQTPRHPTPVWINTFRFSVTQIDLICETARRPEKANIPTGFPLAPRDDRRQQENGPQKHSKGNEMR